MQTPMKNGTTLSNEGYGLYTMNSTNKCDRGETGNTEPVECS